MSLAGLADNRTLAIQSSYGQQAGVWFLDSGKPSGELPSVGRFVAVSPQGSPSGGQFRCAAQPAAVPDGKTIICGGAVWAGGSVTSTGVAVFSARTGRLITIRLQRRLPPRYGPDPMVIWVSPAGGIIMGASLDGRLGHITMLTADNRVRAVPVPRELGPVLATGLYQVATIAW
jgi:hypothetical protein